MGRKEDNEARFDDLMTLIGRVNYSWTNTETLLIHLIAGLAKTDKETAIIIFLTLNTTRARIDLVERLAKMDKTPAEQRRRILSITSKVLKLSGLRNHYNHSLYAFDPDTGSVRTIMMRIADRKNDLKIGRTSDIDDAALGEIRSALDEMVKLNQEFWSTIVEFDYPT